MLSNYYYTCGIECGRNSYYGRSWQQPANMTADQYSMFAKGFDKGYALAKMQSAYNGSGNRPFTQQGLC